MLEGQNSNLITEYMNSGYRHRDYRTWSSFCQPYSVWSGYWYTLLSLSVICNISLLL